MCAQRRLGSAWASAQSEQSSLSTWMLGSLATHWAHTEDSNQTGRMPRLVWVFVGHMPFCWFCHTAAQSYLWLECTVDTLKWDSIMKMINMHTPTSGQHCDMIKILLNIIQKPRRNFCRCFGLLFFRAPQLSPTYPICLAQCKWNILERALNLKWKICTMGSGGGGAQNGEELKVQIKKSERTVLLLAIISTKKMF